MSFTELWLTWGCQKRSYGVGHWRCVRINWWSLRGLGVIKVYITFMRHLLSLPKEPHFPMDIFLQLLHNWCNILRSIAKRLHEEYMHRKVRSFIRHKKMPHESYIYFNDSDNSQSSSINLDASSMPRQMECHAQIANWIKSPAHPYAPISLTLDEKIWGLI
jgi:hypothetical protein